MVPLIRDGGAVRKGAAKLYSVELRRAVPGDENEVAEVHVRSWQVAYRGLLPDAYLDALRPAGRPTAPLGIRSLAWTLTLRKPRWRSTARPGE